MTIELRIIGRRQSAGQPRVRREDGSHITLPQPRKRLRMV